MADDLILATTWHDPARRKLEAVRACHQRDLAALISLVNTYLSYRGRKGAATAAATRDTYQLAIHDWLHYCWPDPEHSPATPVLRATRDDVERYVALLLTRGGHLDGARKAPLTPSTAATYLAGVRVLYRALIWAGALAESPAQAVSGPTDPRPRFERRPALPLEGYKRLVALLEHDPDEASARNLALVRLLGDQGLRVSEVIHLQVSDLDLPARLIHVRRGKGGKTRTVPMSRACFEAIARWLEQRPAWAKPGEQTLLVNVGAKVKKDRLGRAMHPNTVRLQLDTLYQRAGLSDRYRGAHTLRHTAGTRLYRNTRDLHRVAQILGHSDVNTSSIYAKMDVEGLKEAIASLDDD
jgi:integrase/recombinase XerC